MISLSAKVKLPDLKIDCPGKRFWLGVGVTEVKEIHKRTLSSRNVDGKAFDAYSKDYAYKKATGRVWKGKVAQYHSAKGFNQPNLAMTGRMLGSMRNGIRAYKNRVTIMLSGEQGYKAWMIEKNKNYQFFAVSNKRHEIIKKNVRSWMTRKNRLK